MSTSMLLGRDTGGFPTYSINFTEYNINVTLTANVEFIQLPPTNSADIWDVVFYQTPGSEIFVSLNEPAILPISVAAKSFTQGNPTVRRVKATDQIRIITAADNVTVGLSFYAVHE